MTPGAARRIDSRGWRRIPPRATSRSPRAASLLWPPARSAFRVAIAHQRPLVYAVRRGSGDRCVELRDRAPLAAAGTVRHAARADRLLRAAGAAARLPSADLACISAGPCSRTPAGLILTEGPPPFRLESRHVALDEARSPRALRPDCRRRIDWGRVPIDCHSQRPRGEPSTGASCGWRTAKASPLVHRFGRALGHSGEWARGLGPRLELRPA